MTMRLPLAAGYGSRLVPDNPWRSTAPSTGAQGTGLSLDPESLSREQRPVLRVAAAIAAIALAGYALLFVVLLAFLRAT